MKMTSEVAASFRWSRQLGRMAFVLLFMAVMGVSCSTDAGTGPGAQPSIGLHEAEKKKVALVVRAKQDDYWQTVRMGAEAAGKEFNVQVTFGGPASEADPNGQIGFINEAVIYGAGAVVVAPSDHETFLQAADITGSRSLPLIVIDSPEKGAKVRSSILINHYEAGQLALRKLVELIGNHARIAVIRAAGPSSNASQREEGLRAELAHYASVQLVERITCAAGDPDCGAAARDLLNAPGRVDGVVVLSAAASIGVAGAMKDAGLAGELKVVTFDSTPEELELLQEGSIQATIIHNPFSMGYLGVKYAVDAMNGIAVPEQDNLGVKVIDQDNMFWSDNQKLLFPFVN
ncbi:substrate-binding domain-containing protein [Paenibacillus sp. y28]|uniref:substrate-binding domain-containing protein n=1 Tax=Paenibacillus sp. y28 TaxID=3129110 RepID=UPI003019E337